MHDVSVVIPIYNALPYLRACLDGVTAQTLLNLQIICVNDGSTDDSLAVVREYAARDGRFCVVDKENGGYGSAMNAGLRVADGRYIGIVEPDDLVSPRMFERLFSVARVSGFPDIVKSAYSVFTDGHTDFATLAPYAGQPEAAVFDPCAVFAPLCEHPSIWAAIYRRDFLAENGIVFQEIPGAGWADNLFFYKTMRCATGMAVTHEAFYRYRKPAGGGASVLRDCAMPFRRVNEIFDYLEEGVCDGAPAGTGAGGDAPANGDAQGWQDARDAVLFASACKRVAHYIDDVLNSPYFRAEDVDLLRYAGRTLQRIPSVYRRGPFLTQRERDRYRMMTQDETTASTGGAGGAAEAGREARQDDAGAARPADTPSPLVSFVIPVLNDAGVLERCLQSFECQTGADFEVIAVDGGSFDGSLGILNERALRDGRFRVVPFSGAGGDGAGTSCGALMREGLARAGGRYAVFVHPTSYLDSAFLQQVATACLRDDLDVCRSDYSDFVCTDPDHTNLRRRRVSYVPAHYETPFAPAFEQLSFYGVAPFAFGCAIRRELLAMADAGSAAAAGGLLTDTFLKALVLADRMRCLPRSLYYRSSEERAACLAFDAPFRSTRFFAEYAALEIWLKRDVQLWEFLRETYLICFFTACMERLDLCPLYEKRGFAVQMAEMLSRFVGGEAGGEGGVAGGEAVPLDKFSLLDREIIRTICAEPDAFLARQYPAVFDVAPAEGERGVAAAVRERAARVLHR